MYTLHIIVARTKHVSLMDNLNIILLSLMVGSDVFNLIAIGGFHLQDWSWLCIVFAFIST